MMSLGTVTRKIVRLEKEIEEINFSLIEAEGETYDELSLKLEGLEDSLEELQMTKDAMEQALASEDNED